MSADTTPNATTNGTPHLSKFVDTLDELLQRMEDIRRLMHRLEMKRVELDPMAREQMEYAMANIHAGLNVTGRALDPFAVKYLSEQV